MIDTDVPEQRWLAQLRLTAPGAPLEVCKAVTKSPLCGEAKVFTHPPESIIIYSIMAVFENWIEQASGQPGVRVSPARTGGSPRIADRAGEL